MDKLSAINLGVRKHFESEGITLSYLEYGEENSNVLLMLHGHMGNARSFSEVVTSLKDWRIISLDQRGHGWSEHPANKDYSRESYLADIFNLINHELKCDSVTILGHSLGGVNAYQFAARYPELVNAVIVEDIGVEIDVDLSFVANLPERCGSLNELKKCLFQQGFKAIDYFMESVFEDEYGWGLRFDKEGMGISCQNLNGDWWQDWLASRCPILLIHGIKSPFFNLEQAERMASSRPGTRLEVFKESGHDVHFNELDRFNSTLSDFLNVK